MKGYLPFPKAPVLRGITLGKIVVQIVLFVMLWHINLLGLFNAKYILLEGE